MKINKIELYTTSLSTIIVLLVILLPNQNNIVVEWLRIFFWSIFILFLPWYWLTKSFFKENEIQGELSCKDERECSGIDFLERFALSFALSISVVPLISFYLNLLWVKISALSVYFITLTIILANMIYIFVVKKNKYVETK